MDSVSPNRFLRQSFDPGFPAEKGGIKDQTMYQKNTMSEQERKKTTRNHITLLSSLSPSPLKALWACPMQTQAHDESSPLMERGVGRKAISSIYI